MDSPGGYEIFHSLENLHIHFGFQVKSYSQELEKFVTQNNTRCLFLRIGLWSADLKRKFRDININLSDNSTPSNIFTFCFNPKCQEHREMGDCILFVQFIDESGIPIAESTEKINMDNLTTELTIPFIESIYLTGLTRKSNESSVMMCNLCVFQYVGLQEFDAIYLSEKWNVSEDVPIVADPFPQLYISTKGARKVTNAISFVTVQDVNLSEDILQLYKSRTLLVRAKIIGNDSSALKYAFLGFIRGDEAIWFEDVEIGNLQGRKLCVELFTVSKSAQINSRVVESELCHGEHEFPVALSQSVAVPSPRRKISLEYNSSPMDGVFNIDLITNVAISEGMHNDHSCVQVGQIIVKLFHDQSLLLPRAIYSKTSQPDDVISIIDALEFPEDDNLNQYGMLFASTCKNLSCLWVSNPSHSGNSKSNKKIKANLGTMSRLLSIFNRKNYFHEKNVHRWSAILLSSQGLDLSLKALRIFFEDWLVSDTLQLLIERSKDEVVVYAGSNTIHTFFQNEAKWLDDIAKSVFTLLLSRMTSILGKVSAFDQQASIQSSIYSHQEDDHQSDTMEDNDNLMTKSFVQDIAADLLTMLLIYHRKLTHEYLASRDTFIEPAIHLDKCFIDLSGRIQMLSKFLFRILPHTEERNEIIVKDCLLSKSTMELFLGNHSHFDVVSRSQLFADFKQHLLWQLSSLGVIQVYISGLTRVQSEFIPKCMENVGILMGHIDLLTKLTVLAPGLHGESLNFFLCELISVLIACLTKVLGIECDSRSTKLIAKKMNLEHFYADIHEMKIVSDDVSFAASGEDNIVADVQSDTNKNPSALTTSSNLKWSDSSVKSMFAKRVLSMDDLPTNDLLPSPSPIPSTTRSCIPTDGIATGSRLLRSIQDASPCFSCLLKLFLLFLQRSHILNEQEQLTATQVKTYLNSIFFAVVNAKDFRPVEITKCLTTYFSGAQTNSSNDDIRQGLMSLVDLLCCIDKVYYSAMLKQPSRSQVDSTGLVKDMYLSLSFYIAFANMSQSRLNKALLTGQEIPSTKKPTSRLQVILAAKQSPEASEEAQQRQQAQSLIKEKRFLRHRLLECIHIMMEEMLSLLQQQALNSVTIDDALLGCLESCTIVLKMVMGIAQIPRLCRCFHGKSALRTLYPISYLQEEFRKIWQLLLRMYSLPNAAELEAYPAYAAARLQVTSMMMSVIEVNDIELSPFSNDSTKTMMQQDDDMVLAEEIPSCAKWIQQTRKTMHQFFLETLLQQLFSLSHQSSQSIMMICQDILESPSTSTFNDTTTAPTILEKEIPMHTLLVDLMEALRWHHHQEESRSVRLCNRLLQDSLFRQVQELLLSMRAFAQVAHGYVPTSASFERPLCHYMMSIAGTIPIMLFTTQRNMKKRLRHQPHAYTSSLANMQRQLNILKRFYTPIVRSRISHNKVVVLEEADILKAEESRFDEDFSWENFMGKSEYAFVQVWQFLLYVNMNITRVMAIMNNHGHNPVDFQQMMHAFADSVGLVSLSDDSSNSTAMAVNKWQVQLQDKEVQTLRDAVTQLMATGYWELAAKLIDFYGAVVEWHQEKQQQLQYMTPISATSFPVDAHVSRLNSPVPPSGIMPAASTRSTNNSIFTFENTSGNPSNSINKSAIIPPFSPVKSLMQAGGPAQLYKTAHSLAGHNSHTMGTLSPLQSPLATARMRKGIFPAPPPNAPPMTPMSQTPKASTTSPIPSTSSTHITPIMNAHSSPKRNDMLKKELHRMQTKIQEKLKFDKFLRTPPTFIALHFFSSVPNFYTLDNLRQCFDPLIVLRADAFSPNFSTSNVHSDESPASSLGDTSSVFYEQWFVLKVDIACYTACMDYYRYYLQEGQHKVADYRKTGHASYLQHPLQATSLMQRLMTCFPEYTCLPPHYDVRQMAAPVSATLASTDVDAAASSTMGDMFQGLLHPQEIPSVLPRSAFADNKSNNDSNRLGKEMEEIRQVTKFLQIHPVYVAELVNASQQNSTIFDEKPLFTKSSKHNEGETNSETGSKNNDMGEEEDDEEQEEEDDVGENTQEIIQSQDVNDLVDGPATHSNNHAKHKQHITRVVRKHLDKTHIDFTHFPTQYYVYCPYFPKQQSPQESKKKKKQKPTTSSMEDLFATALNRDGDKEILRVCLNVSAQSLESLYPSAVHDPPVPSQAPHQPLNKPQQPHSHTSRTASPTEKSKPMGSETYHTSSLLGSRRGAASAVSSPTPQQILQQALALAETRPSDTADDTTSKMTTIRNGDDDDDDECDTDVMSAEGDQDLAQVRQELLQKVNTTALSSWNVAWEVDSLPMLAVHAGVEVLFQQAVTLARCQRMLRHILSLKTTEIANQPEQSLLHTDTIFQYVCCYLSELLQQPGHCIVSLLNAEHIVMMEKERHEVRWQAIRKHGKREYMRQLALFEEEQHQHQHQLQHQTPPATHTTHHPTVNRKRPPRHQDTEKLRPKEPDWEALREEYDAQSGMDHVHSLSILSQHCWRRVRHILQALRKVVNKLQDIETASNNNLNSGNATKDDVGGSARFRQLSKFSANVHVLDAAEAAEQQGVSEFRPVDSDVHLKQKLLLYVESLYAAAEIGIDLS